MSSGGLRFVKAMGLPLEGRQVVQVSMKLTNFEKTPAFRVFELVKREAARLRASPSFVMPVRTRVNSEGRDG